MKQTITIKGVDVKLLEKQRKAINNSLFRVNKVYNSLLLNGKEIEHLQGICNMLDAWSDEIYWKKYTKGEVF